jgi:DNA-binding MurR/RpiR family transcriptional regulator
MHKQSREEEVKGTHIFERIEAHKGGFSRKQMAVAEYLIHNYKQAAFLSCPKMAEASDVSPATLCRFAAILGYTGYPEMQGALQEMVQAELTTEDRLNITAQKERRSKTQTDHLRRILLSELESMEELVGEVQPELLDTAAQMMRRAKKIVVAGLLGSACLAHYLAYNLAKVHDDVVPVIHGDAHDIMRVSVVDPKSLVFLITFPRYPRMIVEFGRMSRQAGAAVIGITNNVLSPITTYCDFSFYVNTKIISFMDSFAAPITLIHALVANYTRKHIHAVKGKLKHFENTSQKQNVFFRD